MHNERLKLLDIADEEIYWQPDCESEITQQGIGIEPYEQELIDFWENNQLDLESIELEIGKLWKFAVLPATSAAGVLRAAVQQLRSTADGLRGRSTTISHPDANTLLSRFAGLDAFAERIPALFAERVQADDDAWVLAATALKEPPADPEIGLTLSSRGPEIEEMGRMPLRTLVLPRHTRCLAYLLAGPSTGGASRSPGEILQPEGRLFWYAPGPKAAVAPPAVPNTAFYYPTRAAEYLGDLFADYSRFASGARIEQRAATVRGGRYKDKQANLALGGEILKPCEDPTDVWTALTHPAVAIAAAGVMELETRVPSYPPEKLLATYGVAEGTTWSVYVLIEAVARTVAARFPQPKPSFLDVPKDFEKLLRSALSELAPNEKGDVPDSALPAMTATPHAGLRSFLKVLLRRLVTLRMAACVPHDASVAGAVLPEIVPWMLTALEEIAREKGMDLSAAPAQLATWLPDFEKRRRTLTAQVSSAATA